jgi:hypothetical protein
MAARRDVQRMRTARDWELLASCTSQVNLLELSGGKLMRLILAAANGLFWLNHKVALAVCRVFNI